MQLMIPISNRSNFAQPADSSLRLAAFTPSEAKGPTATHGMLATATSNKPRTSNTANDARVCAQPLKKGRHRRERKTYNPQ